MTSPSRPRAHSTRASLVAALALCACSAPSTRPGGVSSKIDDAASDAHAAHDATAADSRLDLPNQDPSPQVGAEPRTQAIVQSTEPAPTKPAAATPEAEQLLKQGRLAEAHALIGQQLLDASYAAARAALEAHEPEDALVRLDEALKIAPVDPRLHYLRAIGLLSSVDAALARGAASGLVSDFPTDALQSLAHCPSNAAVEHAAAHAATLASQWQDALRHARAAATATDAPEYPWLLSIAPARARYDAWWLALRKARAGEASSVDTAELLEACRAELGTLIAFDAADAWPWLALSEQEQQAGERDEALAVLERAIARQPDQLVLWNAWRERARAAFGASGAADRAEALAEKHPQTGAALLVAGQERFEAALERLAQEPTSALAAFRAAQDQLGEARAAAPELASTVSGFEVVCIAGAGWASLALGRSDDAEALFRSMADVVPNGCEWRVEGKLGSGIEGLDTIGRDLSRRWEQTRDLAVLERAAAVYALLHDAQPDEPAWSNNTGFLHRDLAVELAQRAAAFCAAARGEPVSPERAAELRSWAPAQELEFAGAAGRAALRELADRLNARARDLMQQSWSGYATAVEQSPDDVRTLNDAALVQVFHLRTDLARAQALLRRSIELGAAQLEDASLSERARYELKNALGDAHQNLGVLLLVHEQRRADARDAFEKALAIGPDPRPLISTAFLPACADGADIAQLPEANTILHWGEPCGS